MTRTFWRRGWDLNPRRVSPHTISNLLNDIRWGPWTYKTPGQRHCESMVSRWRMLKNTPLVVKWWSKNRVSRRLI